MGLLNFRAFANFRRGNALVANHSNQTCPAFVFSGIHFVYERIKRTRGTRYQGL